MAQAMGGWGRYELSKRLSLSIKQRELIIDRVTALCRCEYEWGVHVGRFGDRVGLTEEQTASLTHGGPHDGCWPAEEAVLIQAVDELHHHADLIDETWDALASVLGTEQILDLQLLAGWYHAISYAANAARVPLEATAPRFAEVADGRADRIAPRARSIDRGTAGLPSRATPLGVARGARHDPCGHHLRRRARLRAGQLLRRPHRSEVPRRRAA